ncbi:MAG: ribosome small subunit-dependent GTPase A, partial [Clostridia bacterium]|nr:ribosome small subunit-dependent GTPase A [Clostridia bacterium]
MSDKFYRVITHKSNEFEIFDGQVTLTVKARGKLKREGEILVGDFVTVEEKNGEMVIKTVKKRENSLIRPAVANIDAIVLVV